MVGNEEEMLLDYIPSYYDQEVGERSEYINTRILSRRPTFQSTNLLHQGDLKSIPI
jgi:hypothetical protein